MVLNIIILRIYYPFQTIVLALPTTSANLAMDWGPTSKPYWSTNCHCIHLSFKPSNEKISILFKFLSRKRQIILLHKKEILYFDFSLSHHGSIRNSFFYCGGSKGGIFSKFIPSYKIRWKSNCYIVLSCLVH